VSLTSIKTSRVRNFKFVLRGASSDGNSMSASAATPFSDDGTDQESGPRDSVRLPPTYVLRRRHVVDALKGVPADARNVTV
jgi:hypothetical protein